MKERRKLQSKVIEASNEEKGKSAIEAEAVKLEIRGAKQILFMYSFMNPENIPFNLRKEEDDSESYMLRRAKEVLEGEIDPDRIEVQRPANPSIKEPVTDTGFEMAKYTHCEGGITVFNQLLEKGWIVTDAHWKIKKSQQAIKSGNGHTKYQVVISLSQEGEEAKLDDITCKGILRLMRMTWAVHAWDNRHLSKKNVVLNFPRCQGTTPPANKFVLK